MDLRQLRYFVMVVEAGSFLGASRRLNVSQPALSMRLKELELSLGASLFQRHSRGVTLTEAGAALLGHAHDILAGVERAQKAVAAAQPNDRLLALGVTPTPATTLVPPVLERCGSLVPPLRLQVQQGSTQEILELLAVGALDGVLSFSLPPRRSAFDITPLYSEDLVLVGLPDLVDSNEGDIPFKALSRFPLILDPQTHQGRRMITQAAADAALSLDIRGDIEPRAVKRSLMLRSRYCSFILFSSFVQEITSGLLGARRVIEPRFTLTLYLILRKAVRVDTREDFAASVQRVVANIIAEGRLPWRQPESSRDGG